MVAFCLAINFSFGILSGGILSNGILRFMDHRLKTNHKAKNTFVGTQTLTAMDQYTAIPLSVRGLGVCCWAA